MTNEWVEPLSGRAVIRGEDIADRDIPRRVKFMKNGRKVCGGGRRPLRGRVYPDADARPAVACYLNVVTPDERRFVQCGNDRWHEWPKSINAPEKLCAWGLMPYYDARAAHEAARRIRYRIPQWWEWAVLGVLAVGEAARLVVGDGGLLP